MNQLSITLLALLLATNTQTQPAQAGTFSRGERVYYAICALPCAALPASLLYGGGIKNYMDVLRGEKFKNFRGKLIGPRNLLERVLTAACPFAALELGCRVVSDKSLLSLFRRTKPAADTNARLQAAS